MDEASDDDAAEAEGEVAASVELPTSPTLNALVDSPSKIQRSPPKIWFVNRSSCHAAHQPFSRTRGDWDLLESKCPREVKNDRPAFGAPSINGSAEVGDSIYHAVYQFYE